MEAKLAGLSDIVIIIVESPGTLAELGAFSLSDPLRKKLLPLLDKKYRTGQSFVAVLHAGPTKIQALVHVYGWTTKAFLRLLRSWNPV